MKIEVTCRSCSVSFLKQECEVLKTKNNFCSKSCAAKFNNIGISRNPPKFRKCKKCKNEFIKSKSHKSKLYCSNCLKDYDNRLELLKSMSIHDFQVYTISNGYHPSWKNSQIRYYNRTWNASLKFLGCAICGYTHHVEFAHIKPLSSFPETATLGEVNHPNNVIQLCPNHHWELDNGILNLESVKHSFDTRRS